MMQRMPNYEFRCQSCSKQFLKSLPFGSKELPGCPICKGATKRLISSPTVHFKGGGFYKTDSAKKSETKQSEPAKAPAAPSTPATPSPKNP